MVNISSDLAVALDMVPAWFTEYEMIPDFRDEQGRGWFWDWEGRVEEPKRVQPGCWVVWVRTHDKDDDCA